MCYQGYCLEQPLLLLVGIPVFFALLFFLFKDVAAFRSEMEREQFARRKRGLRLFMLFTRSLMALMLLVAFARPFTTVTEETHGDPVIKVLVDNSVSMDVFGERLEAVKKALPGKPLDITQVAAGERSPLGDGILKSIEGGDNLLLLSDGRATDGKDLLDVAAYARGLDTRLFALRLEPEKTDAWVTVAGPAETIEDTTNAFKVRVHNVGSTPAFTLQVFVDDQLVATATPADMRPIEGGYEREILQRFGTGTHTLTAKITAQDLFAQNNVFFRSVKSIERPDILLVTSFASPIEQGLREIYDLTVSPAVPTGFQKYDAVVFDDVPYASVAPHIDALTGYLLNGGGLFFIGGPKSFDRGEYKGTLLESMLPVNIGAGKVVSSLENNVIIVLDVSESQAAFAAREGSQGTALDLGKGMALKMVEQFQDDVRVGLVAFASVGQLVTEPAPLSENREQLGYDIKRLGKGQGTDLAQGLLWADIALDQVKGTKNVILISDGKMGNVEIPSAPKLMAQKLAKKGVRIYTVGMPSTLYEGDVDINRAHLRLLASIGGGNYFEPNEFQYLNVFFGKPEAKDQIFSGSSNLAILDREHFITRDLDLNARITGVNFVTPKVGTRNLIFTGDGNPVVNTWNFGLGRVVTLATDDGREWAGELLSRQNSQLLTRSINYAVGNPEKAKEIQVDAKDTYVGEGSEIRVKSVKYPVSKDLTFAKQGTDLYSATFTADKPGFYRFFDAIVAVNAPREYFGLGVSPQLEAAAKLSGGAMVDLDTSLAEQLTTYTKRTEERRLDASFWPLGALAAIFIMELFVRKLQERAQT